MDFDFSYLSYWRPILAGFELTITLSAAVMVTASALGLLVGIGRHFGSPWLRVPLTFYIDSMRAVPTLAVMVWTFFAFPLVAGITLPAFWAALAALTIQIAAYMAEIVRAGLASIRIGQTYAGLTLGMSHFRILRRILLPQAIVRILPPYGSLLSAIIKDTAIASTIAVPELMNRSQVVAQQSFRPIEVYTTSMLLYFVILFPVTRGVDRIYRRVAHLGRS